MQTQIRGVLSRGEGRRRAEEGDIEEKEVKWGWGEWGGDNPPWPGRNSPVPFPAGSLTSYCVRRGCVLECCERASCRRFLKRRVLGREGNL